MQQPSTPPSSSPLRKKRKRTGGKRTVKSCTSCRAAHLRCVADRYGVPCERCAKKSWTNVSSLSHTDTKAPLFFKLSERASRNMLK
ncbi:hypothetical protein GGS24DRAFT_465415 [Hypoxylon argillaceum]|nr:hypothetical protein GGS24DRAFT_465415 [Hypoxylon argillaceum]